MGAIIEFPPSTGGGGSAIGGAITGATEGSVLFAGVGGILQQDNANFFWDDTNNRLGLGTVTPSVRLHSLSTTEQLRLGYDAANFISATVSSAGALALKTAVNSTTGFQFQDSGGMSILTIDTTNDQITANIGANTVGIFKGGANITPNLAIGASGGKAAGIFVGTSFAGYLYDSTGSFSIGTDTRATIVAGTTSGGIARIFLNSAGNIALLGSSGATNATPVDYVQIGDPTNVNQTFGASEIRVRFGTSTRVTISQNNGQSSGGVILSDGALSANLGANAGVMTLNGKAGDTLGVAVGLANAPVWSSIAPVQYSTGTASQSGTTVTGVGTTWTTAMVGSIFTFNVTNGTAVAGVVTAFGSATSLTLSVSQTVASNTYRISYPAINVTSAGLVGIGSATPGAKLTVGAGDIQLDNNFSLKGKSFAGTTFNFATVSTADNVTFGAPSGGDFYFVNASTMVLKSTGTVGIGTATVSAKFHVIHTSEQQRIGYDATNFYRVTVDSAGKATLSTQGTSAGLILAASGEKVSHFGVTPIVRITTGVSAATFVTNTSGIINDSATYGGYTMGQIAQALINYGLLT